MTQTSDQIRSIRDLLNHAASDLDTIASSLDQPPTPTPTPAPPPQPPPTTSGFRGLLEFASLDHISNPHLIGGGSVRHWGDLEKQDGVFDFSSIITDIQACAAVGKKCYVRINTAMPHNVGATPQWLLDRIQKVTTSAGSILPDYFDQGFIAARKRLAENAAQALQPHAKDLAWWQISLGIYGESKVDALSDWNKDSQALLNAWQQHGYSDDAWFAWIKDIVTHDITVFGGFAKLAVAVEGNTFSAHTKKPKDLIDWLATVGVLPQNDGYRTGDDISIYTAHANIQEPNHSAASTGESFDAMLRGMVPHSTYTLVFKDDITQQNDASLAWAAQLVGK